VKSLLRWAFAATTVALAVDLDSGVAQPSSKRMYRIGFISVSDASSSSPNRGAFIEGMRQFGYQEGKDYSIEPRYAEGKLDRLPTLAAELVELKVDVIVLGSIPSALAAQRVAKNIPIVVAAAGDFVGNGLVASLQRPGGSITGLDEVVPGLAGERLRLLAQAVPLRSPVAVLSSATGPTHAKQMQDTKPAAASLGIELVVMQIADAKDFERAFAEMAREKASAVVVFSGVLTNIHRKRIVELAAQYRLPTIHWNAAYVASGGLMSYGPNPLGMYKRSAVFVDKILKGTSPSVLPIEYPQEFELIINLKAANELGLSLPKALLEKADRLLE
jgi:putative tryptophan/tyrosine transport system substrate-binding protein